MGVNYICSKRDFSCKGKEKSDVFDYRLLYFFFFCATWTGERLVGVFLIRCNVMMRRMSASITHPPRRRIERINTWITSTR